MPAEKTPKLVGITVKKSDDFSEWYNQVVVKAELADYSPVHGFMVIRPHGMQLWEGIQSFLDKNIKKLGVENAYFPLLIPESFFNKEKEHAEGFAPEVAWIAQDEKENGGERLAIRPTSETLMYDMYSKWIRSHRDLPLRINQWCNIVRWEITMTKLFIRTREFLWQEGHCVYATHEEELDETMRFLMEYQKVYHELLAIPVIAGKKTQLEKFAGAQDTFTLEAWMPDGKALQGSTSHDLGQNFAKAFNITFAGEDEQPHIPWQNSWGLSTRVIGALIMVHGDDKGLVLPPRLARNKVVIVPILFSDSHTTVLDVARKLSSELRAFGAWVDAREQYSAGWKFNEWELKGIPIRIELGPRDVGQNQCVLVRRDTGEKKIVSLYGIDKIIESELDAMHHSLFSKAEKHLKESMVEVKTMREFEHALEQRKLIRMLFCGSKECEKDIKDKTMASSRCIPLDEKPVKNGLCVHCGKSAEYYTLFSKAY
ncbi:MAG: proline--tRNA ligase [Candidatus Diapherotrites archaeon]